LFQRITLATYNKSDEIAIRYRDALPLEAGRRDSRSWL